jgi:hypothetical protein
VHEAIARWAAAGADISSLSGVRFAVADLPEGLVGLTTNGFIQIDMDAAGAGWFIDSTPAGDTEFAVKGSDGASLASPVSPAFGLVDALSVIEHEIGNALGLPEIFTGTHQVMEIGLSTGVRRSPSPREAGSAPVPVTGTAAELVTGAASNRPDQVLAADGPAQRPDGFVNLLISADGLDRLNGGIAVDRGVAASRANGRPAATTVDSTVVWDGSFAAAFGASSDGAGAGRRASRFWAQLDAAADQDGTEPALVLGRRDRHPRLSPAFRGGGTFPRPQSSFRLQEP